MNESSHAAATPASTASVLHDVVVVGGGAAGLSAALVLTRARRDVVVVDAGKPRNAPAAHMQGFLGSDGLPPSELLAAGRAEVAGYGGQFVDATVTAVVPRSSPARATELGFEVRLDSGESMWARRVLVTTGLRDVIPDIPGARERWGKDLLRCPYCHGYEVRGEPLGVLVGSPDGIRDGWVAVDGTGRTSVTGVWAAGNAVNPRAQVITAAGEGSAAAIAINNDLVEEDLALETFRLGLTS